MFGFGKTRPPLSTAQRVDIELLMRRSIEVIGTNMVREAIIVRELSELQLDLSSHQHLLESVKRELRNRLPMITPCEISITREADLGYHSQYRSQQDGQPAKIQITEETLNDPLRTVVELSYQHATHFWHLHSGSTELDRHPRTTNLLPVCCGLGVLASDACLYDQQWSQAGWTGWSMSRSGYYTPVEIGYALALLARVRGETSPAWADSLRLDSAHTARMAWRFFDRHENAGGRLLLDANTIPSTSCDMAQLASWLSGNDRSFALAAAYALSKRDDLSPLAIQSALKATRSKDKDLVPVATRLLGSARTSGNEIEHRLRELIRGSSPHTSLAAIQSADQLGIPLAEFGATIRRLLDTFAEDSIVLLELIGRQGESLAFLTPQVTDHLGRAISAREDELSSALIECLRCITDDPRRAIESRIRPADVRREAIDRLSHAALT